MSQEAPARTGDLWSANTPARFWCCRPDFAEEIWQTAVVAALGTAPLPFQAGSLEEVLALALGEGQFGPGRWTLGPARRAYYAVKPLLPRAVARGLRRLASGRALRRSPLGWPAEDRFAGFLWEVLRHAMACAGNVETSVIRFWPFGARFALVLTHDIETAAGQRFVPEVAALERRLGFRSCFNFVAEGYRLDHGLIRELQAAGFEVGIHGLRHDGSLFRSRAEFERQAQRINDHLRALGAVSFRAPLTHRNLEWMQALEVEVDLSCFDTDPFEPMPGGCMSLWPFTAGRFVELPYTLAQDSTLVLVLGERTPRLWLSKLNLIERHHGMALLNTHPDYLRQPRAWSLYEQLLSHLVTREGRWGALPRQVGRWWRARAAAASAEDLPGAVMGRVVLDGDRIELAV